jgi:hypothetical protein
MLPRTRENQHEEKPVHPLLQTGAFRSDIDERISVVAVYHADDMIMSRDVNIKDMLQHPTALVE